MATDQEIRDAGLLYIPKQKYLQNPYNLPVEETPPPPDGGITNTNAFANSGNDGFSVYNPDPNSIVNRNADSTRYNNLMENSYLKGGSNSTVPKYLNEPYNPSIKYAQAAYDQANQAINQGKGNLISDYQGEMYKGPKSVFQMREDANDMIMDNRQNYGAQGQYETVPSEFAYSSQTELDKFKDNYPEYFDLNQSGPKTGIPGLIEKYMTNSFLGKGLNMAGNFLGNIAPTNRRAMLENQLGARGVMVNDIGQIVQGDGAYDTAGNVMAGYNANKMTAETFDKRIANIQNTLEKKYGSKTYTGDKTKLDERLAAIEAAKADFLKSQKESDFMYDETEEEKNKKKKKGNIITRFLTKKKETKAAKAAKAAADAQAAAAATGGGSYDAPGGVTSSNYNQAANIAGGGGGNTATNAQGQTAREATYDGNKNTGTAQGYSQHYATGGRAGYFFGGRVGFKNGGLASIL